MTTATAAQRSKEPSRMPTDESPDARNDATTTEQTNPASAEIDRMTPLEIVQVMNAEDRTVAAAVERELPAIAAAVEAIAARLRSGGRLIYLGAGTSGRLGALDAYECPPTFGVAPESVIGCVAGGSLALTQSSEQAEDNADAGRQDVESLQIGSADVLVGITASGSTPYVLGAVAAARAAGTLIIGVVCNQGTRLHEVADIMIAPLVGPEVIAGSTRLKAGTAQKMALNMLSTGAMVLLGKTFGNLMVDVRATNQKLHQRARAILQQATGLSRAECEERLAAANGELKTAIVAARTHLSADEARERLSRHGNIVRAALEEPA
jgi:N-acetylmuramic acid 6-phosphate etherase